MNDRDIRVVLKEELLHRYKNDENTLVFEEFGLRHGAARIDLVVVNDWIHGYEIKSDRDSLRRLPDQIRVYNSVMDRITIAVGYRYAYEVLRMVPEWWGVKLAENKSRSGTVSLSDARLPHNNPKVDLNEVVALLWRGEALAILEEMGAAKGVRSKSRTDIYRRLVEVSSPEYLRARIRQQLKSRKEWKSGAQRMSCGD